MAKAWEAVARAAHWRCGGNDTDEAGALGWRQILIGFTSHAKGMEFFPEGNGKPSMALGRNDVMRMDETKTKKEGGENIWRLFEESRPEMRVA